MQNWVELHLKPATLKRYGLPDIPYGITQTDLQAMISGEGDLPLAVLLHGLQQRSRDGGVQWQEVEAAMDRIAELLAPDDEREVITAAGDHWWLEIGPLDLNTKLVTIQRGDALIAAITPRNDGRLRVAVFRPLDAKSAEIDLERWGEELESETVALCQDILGIETGDIVLAESGKSTVRLKVEGMNVYSSDERVMFGVWGTRFRKDGLPGKRSEHFAIVVEND